jgi:hypothetical protein
MPLCQGSWLKPSSGEAEFSLEAKVVTIRRMSCSELFETITGVGEQCIIFASVHCGC